MRFLVEVKFSKQEKLPKKITENSYIIYTNKKPKNNEANLDVINQLAKALKTAKSNLKIVAGQTSKHKILEAN